MAKRGIATMSSRPPWPQPHQCLDLSGVAGFGRQNEEGVLLSLHPTVKPVALVADAILDCSRRGALVLDAFLGSGTTLIAAKRTGRTCYGMELDPLYVDTIILRWQAYAGAIARHAACYDVGYCKPPLHTRFRKGRSGNPKGRSKGTKNFATGVVLEHEMNMASRLEGGADLSGHLVEPIRFADRLDRVKAQSVEAVFHDPVERILGEEVSDLRPAEVDRRPQGVARSSRNMDGA
jgi:hypothetical protein